MLQSRLEAGTQLVINVTSRRLGHYRGDTLMGEHPVAIGKPATPTPTGHYSVVNKVLNPGGILGTRWMGLSIPNGNYGIHGTNNPSSIGKAVSLGCIRMHNHDVESLFPQVSIGTPVLITAAHTEHQQAASPQQGGGKTYTVQPGDTLWKIAHRLGLSPDALVQANQLNNPDRLEVGQILIIP